MFYVFRPAMRGNTYDVESNILFCCRCCEED